MRVAGSFRAGPDAPSRARELVRGLRLDPDARANLELIVTELVANSVVHGGGNAGEVTVDLRADQACVLGEICDAGSGFDWEPHAPDLTEPGGLGLLLVDKLTEGWGVSRDPTACVWFVCAAA